MTEVPKGVRLAGELKGASGKVYQRLAFSPDGRWLAAATDEGPIEVWDWSAAAIASTGLWSSGCDLCWAPDGRQLATTGGRGVGLVEMVDGRIGAMRAVAVGAIPRALAWARDGASLVVGLMSGGIEVIGVPFGVKRTITGHGSRVYGVALSPNGEWVATVGWDSVVRVAALEDGAERWVRRSAHKGDLGHRVAWDPEGGYVWSVGDDGQLRRWDAKTGEPAGAAAGHSRRIVEVALGLAGCVVGTASADDTVRLWSADTLDELARLPAGNGNAQLWPGLSFHPTLPILAALGPDAQSIHLWELDPAVLLGAPPAADAVRYTCAKVVLVGDSGVGKTGLGLVLSGEPWRETGSTHGRHVWTFSRDEAEVDGRRVIRETVLWDLAGQPAYRLVHQLHLDEVALAVVVFDGQSEDDPLAGVRYWERALAQARRHPTRSGAALDKLLVVGRADRGGVALSPQTLDRFCAENGFSARFQTSAKAGTQMPELRAAIAAAIRWDELPWVSSNDLFVAIQRFLLDEKEQGAILVRADDLFRSFSRTETGRAATGLDQPPLRPVFDTCIGLLEGQGLVRRLAFGGLVLLQPELLDAYASALVNAARDQSAGLGCVGEAEAHAGRFALPDDVRVTDREVEKLLLVATVEDLVAHQLALREASDGGIQLVFPAQLTREHPDLPDPQHKLVTFRFTGPVLHVYATLVVRLARSELFQVPELWRNAALYPARAGGRCGLHLRAFDDGRGELVLFHDGASAETGFQFEEYVRVHLLRRAVPDSVERRRAFVCGGCGQPVADGVVEARRKRGFDFLRCPVCEVRVSLADGVERVRESQSAVARMDRAADAARDRERATQVLEGKRQTQDFDVFLCYNTADKAAVEDVGSALKERGYLPWMDAWELRPGLPWQPELERQIEKIKAAAVFVGAEGMGPWQRKELDAFLRVFHERGCPVIPVLLPEAGKAPKLPVFLSGHTWVDLRVPGEDPLSGLIWGITGKRPDPG